MSWSLSSTDRSWRDHAVSAAKRKPRNKSAYSMESFAARANEAAFWEAWVGAVLARCGLYTVHHPFTVAQTMGETHAYAQTWDMDVSECHPSEWEYSPPTETEVKSLSLTFTMPDDYPHDEVLVCSAKNHGKKYGKDAGMSGRDFLLVSRATGAIVWVPRGTCMFQKEVTDNERGQTYMAMACKREDLRALKSYVQAICR